MRERKRERESENFKTSGLKGFGCKARATQR